jgi:hypothetical protein
MERDSSDEPVTVSMDCIAQRGYTHCAKKSRSRSATDAFCAEPRSASVTANRAKSLSIPAIVYASRPATTQLLEKDGRKK